MVVIILLCLRSNGVGVISMGVIGVCVIGVGVISVERVEKQS